MQPRQPWGKAPQRQCIVLAQREGTHGSNLVPVSILLIGNAPSPPNPVQVLAAVRGPLVVLFGVMLFSEHVTLLESFGYSM